MAKQLQTLAALGAVAALFLGLVVVPHFRYPLDPAGVFDEETFQAKVVQNDTHHQLGSHATTTLNIVVTGANAGLGWASVQHFVQLFSETKQVHIVMACRSMEKCAQARDEILLGGSDKVRLTCRPLDLSLRTSIESFARSLPDTLQTTDSSKKEVVEDEDSSFVVSPIHILLNNGGVFAAEDGDYSREDGIETQVKVNHLGHFYLTHCLWKHLKRGRARVVTVSSLAAILPLATTEGWWRFQTPNNNKGHEKLPWWKLIFGYSRSKRANLMFAAELQDRCGDSGAIAASLASHPGYTRTNIMLSGIHFLPMWFRQFLHVNAIGSMSIEQGAWTQVRAALDETLSGGFLVGPKGWTTGRAVPVADLRTTRSLHFWPFTREESQQLWNQSLEALKIQEFGRF